MKKARGRTAPRPACVAKLPLCPYCLRLPDFHLTSLRHQEQTKHEAYRRNSDRVDQSIAETASRLVRSRGDEWHQSAAPAVADVIRHRHRRVADPGGEIFSEERADWAVDHPNIGDQNGDDDDGNRIVDIARL